MPYGSEMNFYKIDDYNYVFSVRASSNGAIRYYSMVINEDYNCSVKRIQNAIAFVTKHNLPKIVEFSPDYAKVITSLISYCDFDEEMINFSEKRKKAIDFSKLTPKTRNDLTNQYAVIAAHPAKVKELDDNSFYAVDSEDKLFISNGIRTNNFVNRFRLK